MSAEHKQRQELEKFIEDCRDLQSRYVANAIDGSRRNIRLPMYAFRISGVLLILCSVTIPLISSLSATQYPWKDMALSLLALTIAALTSLNSFFRWGDEWRRNNANRL